MNSNFTFRFTKSLTTSKTLLLKISKNNWSTIIIKINFIAPHMWFNFRLWIYDYGILDVSTDIFPMAILPTNYNLKVSYFISLLNFFCIWKYTYQFCAYSCVLVIRQWFEVKIFSIAITTQSLMSRIGICGS